MTRDALICLVLFCAVTLLFAPARNFEFLNYDDPELVHDPVIRGGLTAQGFRWSMHAVKLANWHPITLLSHMTDAQLFGPDNPAGPHLVNVLLHAANGTLLFLALRMMTGSGAAWESAIVAALWAVHPLRVESVAWVAERKDLLCATFFLLTLIAYARYARTSSKSAYAMALVMFAMGLMSKPMIVTLPCVLLLIDYFPLKRAARWKMLLLEKLPFFVMTLAFCVVTFVVQRRGGAMGDHYPLSLRIENAFWSYARYLGKTFYPKNLAVFYPYEGALPGTQLPISSVLIAVACLFATTLLASLPWRRNRAILIGWLWFLGTLIPVIGLIQVGWQSMADRYTYIPHIGLLIAIIWGIAPLVRHHPVARTAAMAAACLVAGILSIVTSSQLTYWHDSATLFTHALQVTDHNHLAHSQLAEALDAAGDPAGAIAHYQEQFRIKPEPQPLYNIGRIYATQGKPAEAQRYYEGALAIKSDFADAILNLAHALAAQGKHADAIEQYRRGLQLQPDAARARYYFALELLELRQGDEAREELVKARDVARRQGDSALVAEIDLAISRTPSRPLPNTTQSSENPLH